MLQASDSVLPEEFLERDYTNYQLEWLIERAAGGELNAADEAAALNLPGWGKRAVMAAIRTRRAELPRESADRRGLERQRRLRRMPVDGGALLVEPTGFIRRLLAVTAAQADAMVLWVIHTWAVDAASYTPYLHITSPEMRCGKTVLLEVLELLAARAWRRDRGQRRAGCADAAA